MKLQFITTVALAATLTTSAFAQTDSLSKIKKEETITIRKNVTNNEKTTIVIDGDKITINGKPIDEMNDSDIKVLHGRAGNLAMVAPQIQLRNQLRKMKIDRDQVQSLNLALSNGNKTVLGVSTEKNDKGAKILDVSKESAAEKAGLQKDDIITKIGDSTITNSEDLYKAIGKYNADDKVKITYLRDGKTNTTTATLLKSKNTYVYNYKVNGEPFNFNYDMPRMIEGQPFNFNYNIRKPKLGLQIQDVETGNGVKVLDIDDDTPAAKAGLKKDDIITEVNGKEVKNVDDLKEKLKDAKEGDTVQLKYKRSGKTQSTEIKFPKKLKTADL